MRNRSYLITALVLLFGAATQTLADIPPTPEQRKKIAETPRITPNGTVTPLAQRPFARTVGGGKAKVVIPKAVFDELVAEVTAKAGGEAPPTIKNSGAVPPIALVFAGLALSGAALYLIARKPRFRTVAAAVPIIIIASGVLLWSHQVEANAPVPPNFHLAREGQIIIEVPSEGSEVVIYVPEAESKTSAPEAKPK